MSMADTKEGEALEAASHATNGFLTEDDVFDLDHPSNGFSSISEAIEDIRQGKLVVVVNVEDRKIEGGLVMAASLITSNSMDFIAKHGNGVIFVSMKEEDFQRLHLPFLSSNKENEGKLCKTPTVSVSAKEDKATGIFVEDRLQTILALASPDSKPGDFNLPGHVFLLKYVEGGVLKLASVNEASTDLAILAGLPPCSVLCEIVEDDSSLSSLPKLQEFARQENLKVISVSDLVRYRRKREKLVELTVVTRLPTDKGTFQAHCYTSLVDGIEYVAMVKGDIGDGQDILVRLHSECLTGDIFGSTRCDCGPQLSLSMELIEKAGRGVVLYLRGHEGRGIGLGKKLHAYNLQDNGRDTVEANEDLGLPADSREYATAAKILRDLGVRTMRLLTNNPTKFIGLQGYGLKLLEMKPLLTPITPENRRYMETKRVKMGHVYSPIMNGK